MFWDKWIPGKYLVKSEICGVEVNFSDEGAVYYYSYLKNKRNKLELVDSGSCYGKLELPKIISKNKIPIVVVINGKGVILKKINLSENNELGFVEIIKQNLPAINPTDFFIQLFKQNDFSAFISLCRKELVNDIVIELKNKKYNIAKILIGAPSIIGLQPLWGNFNSIQSSQHQIELTNGVVDSIATKTENIKHLIKIDNISFLPEYSLGFAGGLSYLMQRRIAQSENSEILQIESNHTEKNKFNFLALVVIAIAFVLAITNAGFYSSYFDKNNKLETQLSVYQGKYEQINKLLSDYQNKKGLIENAGVLNKNKLSEYADKIAKTIPDEVVLTEIYFNPKLDKDESEDSLITFQTKQLVIKGNCNKSLIINEWVNVLKMQKFIKEVSLEKFSYNKEGFLPNYEIKLITE